MRVAIVQEPSSFFDKQAGIEQTLGLCKQVSHHGCQLVLFPESFIPGYPRGFTFGAAVGSRSESGMKLFKKYADESVSVNEGDLKPVVAIAKELNLMIGLGVTEKSETGTLYCSLVYITPENGLAGIHRKLKPTGTERVIWGEGSANELIVVSSHSTKIGGLICWENYMPLARMAMYYQGIQIYLAPTADARPTWLDTMKHIAREGRCFVLGCNQHFTKDHLPLDYQDLSAAIPHEMCSGGSVIISPFGEVLSGPLYHESGILYADLDLDVITRAKMEFDVVGHYSRPDLLPYLLQLYKS